MGFHLLIQKNLRFPRVNFPTEVDSTKEVIFYRKNYFISFDLIKLFALILSAMQNQIIKCC